MHRIQIALLTLMLTSCANLNINRSESTPTATSASEFEMHSFLWGFVPGRNIPHQSVLCPKGQIESATLQMNSIDVLLTTLTLGIYVPYRVTIACSK